MPQRFQLQKDPMFKLGTKLTRQPESQPEIKPGEKLALSFYWLQKSRMHFLADYFDFQKPFTTFADAFP